MRQEADNGNAETGKVAKLEGFAFRPGGYTTQLSTPRKRIVVDNGLTQRAKLGKKRPGFKRSPD